MADKEREPNEAEFIERAKGGDCFVVRIPAGENLIQRLRALLAIKSCRRAVVLSGIGSLQDVTYRNLAADATLPLGKDSWADTKEHGPFELVSLTGNVLPMATNPVPHLHAILGTPDGRLVGGHVFDATVFGSTELFVLEVDKSLTVRSRDEETGMAEIKPAE